MSIRVMTEEQRLFYEANGYLVIPNALSPEELTSVREAADRAEALWRADPTRPGARGPNLEQVLAPIEYDSVLRDLLVHPKVFPIAWELLGDDISMIDNDYFIMRCRGMSASPILRERPICSTGASSTPRSTTVPTPRVEP